MSRWWQLKNEKNYILYNLKNKFSYDICEKYCDLFSLDLNSKIAIKKYSLGMRQKAAIIQSVMENQNVILLDEPTRGLDNDSMNQFDKRAEARRKNNYNMCS